ncbi:MAG: hypothetical protein KKA07_18135 [Bacteroidetes bacterium]|nr:hypothetical protein [Bacteroidota bacterium]MBU1720991.1 hypothetical protein [Bacteroidota bacterium]
MLKRSIVFLFLAFLPFCSMAFISMSAMQGTIKSGSQVDRILVKTDHQLLNVVFESAKGMKLWVKIKGQTGNLLAEYDLNTANLITLNGGGQFTLEIYSKGGTGDWKCFAYDTEEGSITSKGQVDKVTVCNFPSPLYLIFEYDEGLALYARIKGKDGASLGEFSIEEGNVLTLEGGGEYQVELFAKAGIGSWRIYYYNKAEYDKLPK